MKLEQKRWTKKEGWTPGKIGDLGKSAQLVLAFGGTSLFKKGKKLKELKKAYPKAHLLGCSTAGEICGTKLSDDGLVVTAIKFDSAKLKYAKVNIQAHAKNSFKAGKALAKQLPKRGLRHVFVISDGQKVNGSELVRGLVGNLPKGITATGGLAGDGARFKQTLVFLDSTPKEGIIGVVGLYGKNLKIGFGSMGGWDSFGPERLVTKSKGNVLYELGGKSALKLYKKYLGKAAKGLPATGLLFPLSVRMKKTRLVRTILNVNEKDQSLIFAGDIPEGSYAQLMKANFDRLVEGAKGAAKASYTSIRSGSPEFAILISCVGRKLILKQRTEEELESVREILGKNTVMTGFYSYGEICPASPKADCELHNQTMTITTISER